MIAKSYRAFEVLTIAIIDIVKTDVFLKQVAQRATIAHLSPMCQHPFISNKPASKVIKNLNSFPIREQLFFQGLVPPMSAI